MLAALAVSFAVIFIAELGDKSQLMAMAFALRYRWWMVITAITTATAGVHLLSVLLGHLLGVALPTTLIAIIGGIAFLLFGAWTIRGDSLTETESARTQSVTRSAFIAVTAAFLLAELGDKTMLATITLATDHDAVGVWIGSTLGMVAADALAIVIGAVAGKHLPEDAIRLGAAVLFFVFGIWMLLGALFPGGPVSIVGAAITLVVGTLAAVSWSRRQTRLRRRALDPRPAEQDQSAYADQ